MSSIYLISCAIWTVLSGLGSVASDPGTLNNKGLASMDPTITKAVDGEPSSSPMVGCHQALVVAKLNKCVDDTRDRAEANRCHLLMEVVLLLL